MRTSRTLIPAVLVLLVGTFWVEAQTRMRRNLPRPGQPSPAPAPPGAPAPEVTSEPTQLSIEFFQVSCPASDLTKLDLRELGRGNPGAGELLKRLSAVGEASLQVRLGNVIDLSRPSTMTRGTRIPIIAGQVKSSDGKVTTPSVTYEQVGATVRAQGYWDEEHQPPAAHISASIELSSVGKSSLQLSEGLQMSEFGQFRVDQEMDLEHGVPVLLMANSQAAPAGEKGDARSTVTIVRLTALKLWGQRKTEKSE